MSAADDAEAKAAIAAGEQAIALLRPLNQNQRAWAVAIVCAEFTVSDSHFMDRLVFMLARAARDASEVD